MMTVATLKRHRVVAPAVAVALLILSVDCQGEKSGLMAVIDKWVFLKPAGAMCEWKDSQVRVVEEIRTALLEDQAQAREAEALQIMLLPSLLAGDTAERLALREDAREGWACFIDFLYLVITQIRTVGKERGIELWERGFVGAGKFFEPADAPFYQPLVFSGLWLREDAIPKLRSFTVLRLTIINVSRKVVSLNPRASVLLVDETGRQQKPYTAFDPAMLMMSDQPFYRYLWGQQLLVYPGQYIEVYLPYDKVSKPKRLIFENFEGFPSPPFYLDLLL